MIHQSGATCGIARLRPTTTKRNPKSAQAGVPGIEYHRGKQLEPSRVDSEEAPDFPFGLPREWQWA
jgi:hypothetical protein